MSREQVKELEAIGDELLRHVAYGDGSTTAEHLRQPAWHAIRRIAAAANDNSPALLYGARALAAELRAWRSAR